MGVKHNLCGPPKFKSGDYLLVEFSDEREVLYISGVDKPAYTYGWSYNYTVISSTKSWRKGQQSAFISNSARVEMAKIMGPKDKLELL